jgi:hypothetical protein
MNKCKIDGGGVSGGRRRFDELVGTTEIAITPVTAQHARIAGGVPRLRQGQRAPGQAQRRRLRRVGPGEGRRSALLFKGNHFTETDVAVALT